MFKFHLPHEWVYCSEGTWLWSTHGSYLGCRACRQNEYKNKDSRSLHFPVHANFFLGFTLPISSLGWRN